MDTITALTTRASVSRLEAPAPDAGELERMFAAALSAPDHGRIRPWRFQIIEGEGLRKFGEVLAEALLRREPDAPAPLVAKEREKPLRAPVIVVVTAATRAHPKVPAIEQVVSAGAAAQNILLAAHALGYGGMWRTGAPAYDPYVKRSLGLGEEDEIVGFLYIGTPPSVPARPQANLPDFVSRWEGAAQE
jgi:nitroreductase